MEDQQSVLRTRLRAVIEEEFYESVAIDGGFFHSVPDEWWDARTDAILAVIEEGRKAAKTPKRTVESLTAAIEALVPGGPGITFTLPHDNEPPEAGK